jgi:hypothetical protein
VWGRAGLDMTSLTVSDSERLDVEEVATLAFCSSIGLVAQQLPS